MLGLKTFVACLRRSNPGITLFSIRGSDHTPASIMFQGEPVCSVSKRSWISERTSFDRGIIVDRGYRAVLDILAGRRLVDRWKVMGFVRKAEAGYHVAYI